MDGKAIIGQCTETPLSIEERLRYTFQVTFFSKTTGFVASELIDVEFAPTDTLAQIKTKIRNTLIARGAEINLTIATADVGSIMQI